VRFTEGFNTAFKPRNIVEYLSNGAYTNGAWVYGGTGTYLNTTADLGNLVTGTDENQNVPGTIYNTEAGFEFAPGLTTPVPNPPTGTGTNPSGLSGGSGGTAFQDANGTGIGAAGVATAGTRLAVSFASVPTGVNIYVPAISYLYRAGTTYGGGTTTPNNPTFFSPGISTGVAILVATDGDGASSSTGFSSTFTGTVANGQIPLQQVTVTSGAGLAVYEVLFADPGSQEQLDIPVVVAYASNLTSNPPIGLPVPNVIATATGSFAPFYPGPAGSASASTARQPSSTLAIPRFIPGTTALNLFEINKCACNLLFPFVSNQLGYDTGIAIANTSLDPGGGVPNTNDFGSAQPQTGTVTLWYYGQGANGATPPSSQTSTAIAAGQLMLYVLSSGNSSQNLDNRGAGFQGYIIAQAGFQYCHAYAFITTQGGTPTGTGVNTGYLGIVLDAPGLARTNSPGENDGH